MGPRVQSHAVRLEELWDGFTPGLKIVAFPSHLGYKATHPPPQQTPFSLTGDSSATFLEQTRSSSVEQRRSSDLSE